MPAGHSNRAAARAITPPATVSPMRHVAAFQPSGSVKSMSNIVTGVPNVTQYVWFTDASANPSTAPVKTRMISVTRPGAMARARAAAVAPTVAPAIRLATRSTVPP